MRKAASLIAIVALMAGLLTVLVPGGGAGAQGDETPTGTVTETTTETATETTTETGTPSVTETVTGTETVTETATGTETATETGTPSATGTETGTPTETETPTETATPTPDDGTFTYELGSPWTLLTWFGPDGIGVQDALQGTGDAEGGESIFDITTAVYTWNPADGTWLGFFPDAVDLPGVNDLETLETGEAYWLAVEGEAGTEWTVVTESGEEPVDPNEIRVGALLSLTGGGATLGATTQAALEIAVQEWNTQLAEDESPLTVVLDVEDTEHDAETVVEAYNALVERGARIIIGPQSSSQLMAIGELAAEDGVILISHGSTASALAGLYESVVRFVPNDTVEGRAMVDLMIEDGIESIVPIWLGDVGNQGLVDSVEAVATAEGLTVATGVNYEPGTTDYTDVLAELSTQVDAAVADAENGADGVAVYLAGFEEVADVLEAAAAVEGLDTVRWYGGDGAARGAALLESEGTVTFATTVGGYPSPLIALPEGAAEANAELIAAIAAAAGSEPDASALAAYDALHVAVTALIAAGPEATHEELHEAFLTAAEGYEGVTGTISLDENGDRTAAPFDFWSICEVDETADWLATAHWEPNAEDPTEPGTITAGSCEEPVIAPAAP